MYSTTTVAGRANVVSRLWASYLHSLKAHPMRTKMATSGTMFFVGDCIAQFGMEGRQIGAPHPEPGHEEDPSLTLPYDPIRALRLTIYGTIVFGPLTHYWHNLIDKIKFPDHKIKTLGLRLLLDQGVWAPFIVAMFWGSNGVLEGKSPGQIKAKVEMAFPQAYANCVGVFAPTQIVNFTLVPLQHRLLVQQSVGLGWMTFLSYVNNINNKRLVKAEAALAVAHAHANESEAAAAAERAAAAVVEKVRARKAKLQDAQGGGATGVGTRMGF